MGHSAHYTTLIAALVILLPSVWAAVSGAPVYTSPSEATLLSGGNTAACKALNFECSHNNYSVITDEFTVLGDGSTISGAALRNASNSQSAFLKLTYDLNGVLNGNYTVRYALSDNDKSLSWAICPNINSTNVNTSDCFNGTRTNDGQTWAEIDVTNLIQKYVANITGQDRFAFRFYITSSNAKTVTEIYLRRPVSLADYQLLAQGVSTADQNQWVENEWLIVTQSDVAMSVTTCTVESVSSQTVLNSTIIKLNYSMINEGKTLKVRWFSNDTQVFAGENYEVSCTIQIGTTNIAGAVEQYVYTTVDGAIYDDIVAILQNILKALHIIREPVKISIIQQYLSYDANTNIVARVNLGANNVAVNSTMCLASIIDSSGTVLLNNGSMSVFGTANLGMVNYSINTTAGTAPYDVRVVCSLNDSGGDVTSYLGTATLNTPPLTAAQIYEGIPYLSLLQQTYVPGVSNKVLAQLAVGSNSVTNADCLLNIYYSNFTKTVDNQLMSYSGDGGIYYYDWTPISDEYQSVNFPARVLCANGSLGTSVIQAATSLEVQNGVRMRSIT